MTEAQEVFNIPVKKRKLSLSGGEDDDGIDRERERLFNLSGGDRILFSATHTGLRTVVEDYIQRTNAETANKQTMLANDANVAKSTYVEKLNDMYKRIMDVVEMKFRDEEKDDKDFLYAASMAYYSDGRVAVRDAFQCVKRDLQDKGWSPVIHEECANDRNITWKINIVCPLR